MSVFFWIAGKHTVLSAIKNSNRNISKIVVSNKDLAKQINNVLFKFKKKITVEIRGNSEIIKILNNKEIAHQGIAALVEKIENPNEKEVIENLQNLSKSTVLILDNLTDQRNIGSIIRSSVAFYVDAIFVLKKNFNYSNENLYKSASGGMEFVTLVPVVNLSNTINLLKKSNYWVVGLDSKGKVNLLDYKWPSKIALVAGSEGEGLRRLVKENCDETGRINTDPLIESLNVSNAVASCLALNLKKKKSPEK